MKVYNTRTVVLCTKYEEKKKHLQIMSLAAYAMEIRINKCSKL